MGPSTAAVTGYAPDAGLAALHAAMLAPETAAAAACAFAVAAALAARHGTPAWDWCLRAGAACMMTVVAMTFGLAIAGGPG